MKNCFYCGEDLSKSNQNFWGFDHLTTSHRLTQYNVFIYFDWFLSVNSKKRLFTLANQKGTNEWNLTLKAIDVDDKDIIDTYKTSQLNKELIDSLILKTTRYLLLK